MLVICGGCCFSKCVVMAMFVQCAIYSIFLGIVGKTSMSQNQEVQLDIRNWGCGGSTRLCNETHEGINKLIKGFNTEHLDTIGNHTNEKLYQN